MSLYSSPNETSICSTPYELGFCSISLVIMYMFFKLGCDPDGLSLSVAHIYSSTIFFVLSKGTRTFFSLWKYESFLIGAYCASHGIDPWSPK
jgi:hypothetical protein